MGKQQLKERRAKRSRKCETTTERGYSVCGGERSIERKADRGRKCETTTDGAKENRQRFRRVKRLLKGANKGLGAS